jgi:hypothetical protein
MPRGENLPDISTPETRAKGGRARAAKIREQKEADAKAIEDAWRKRNEAMDKRLDAIVSGGDDSDALRAILAGQDRLAGKPTQHTELSGSVGLEVDVEAVRAKLDTLINRDKAE